VSLFVCEECGCVENTALGHWWSRNETVWPEEYRRALCSEHGPPTYPSGQSTKFGEWHGRFPQEMAETGDKVNNPEVIQRWGGA